METKEAVLESDLITESQLIQEATTVHNLTITKRKSGEWVSSEMGHYELDKPFLESLERIGFTFEPGRDELRKNMVYLAGHEEQTNKEIYESDCWAWEKSTADKHLTVSFHLFIDERRRGITAIPHIWGNCSGGAVHRPTINKLARAIARYFPDSHTLLQRMSAYADSDALPIIQWTEIKKSGIRSISSLFQEVYGHNELIRDISRSHFSPFVPSPHRHIVREDDRYFVPEELQNDIMEQWKLQLQRFKARLV